MVYGAISEKINGYIDSVKNLNIKNVHDVAMHGEFGNWQRQKTEVLDTFLYSSQRIYY
jgi:hypothetical protein